jgi:homopolymeric O-antigen transport system permease protein
MGPNTQEDLLIIDAGRAEGQYWKDLWRYRELFFFLAWRDILVRYKQTFLGISWSVLRPLLTMIVFTIVFGRLAKLPSGGVPYPLFVFVAMLPWQLFSNSLNSVGNSMIGNSGIISKVYFPRLVIPASAVIVCFVDFLISGAMLISLMFWYHFRPGWQIITVPFFILMTAGLVMGTGLLISALNVKYRDFGFVAPFIVQIGLYISPVGFSSSIIPEKWKLLYSANPMVGIIDGFRWAVLGGKISLNWPGFILSLVISILMLIFGIVYFRKIEENVVDII